MKILYFDIVGGIAGDMAVAALLELGVPLEHLRAGLDALGLEGLRIATEKGSRHSISGTRLLVSWPGMEEGGHGEQPAHARAGTPAPPILSHAHGHGGKHDHDHDHDHNHDRGEAGGRAQAHAHPAAEDGGHDPGNAPAHGHGHGKDSGHRAYGEIRELLEGSALAGGAKELALRIFAKLAEAEGAVHDVPAAEVTFHEVGAWDSIADVVCTALAVDYLAPEAIYCSPVPVGAGEVKTAHGTMPVPAPATLLLLRGFPIVQGPPAYERTTPTGAAILAALARPAPERFAYVPERVGVGLGARDSAEVPNLLRAVLGRCGGGEAGRDTIECAEANLDDANPEWIGYLMERLLEAGALDVALLPVQMKKNRPGTQIQVLYAPALRDTVVALLFSEATTLGVRYHTLERAVLPREEVQVMTPWGEVCGKVAQFDGRARFAPEYEACRAVARRADVPLREVYQAAQQAYLQGSTG